MESTPYVRLSAPVFPHPSVLPGSVRLLRREEVEQLADAPPALTRPAHGEAGVGEPKLVIRIPHQQG